MWSGEKASQKENPVLVLERLMMIQKLKFLREDNLKIVPSEIQVCFIQ